MTSKVLTPLIEFQFISLPLYNKRYKFNMHMCATIWKSLAHLMATPGRSNNSTHHGGTECTLLKLMNPCNGGSSRWSHFVFQLTWMLSCFHHHCCCSVELQPKQNKKKNSFICLLYLKPFPWTPSFTYPFY